MWATDHSGRVRRGIGGLFLLASLGLACARDAGPEWPGFRGPGGLGVSPATDLPVEWGKDSIRWKAPLPGRGNSSPIVSDGRVFITTAYPDEASEAGRHWRAVLAFDLRTGAQLWETRIASKVVERRHRINSVAAPTPATDGKQVFVFFGSVLAALTPDGAVNWTREVDPEYVRYSRYGAASSLALTERAVIVFADREYGYTEDLGWLGAFDKLTGEQLWRNEWDHTCCAYSTPVVIDRGAGEEILVAHSGRVAGYDAATGERMWEHLVPIQQNVSGPVYEGDWIGLAGGADHVRHSRGIRLTGLGHDTTTEVLWDRNQLIPQVSTPLLYNGIMFTVTDKGVMAALEPETGNELWRTRLDQTGSRAALIGGDGKVYVWSEYGKLAVVAAAPELRILAQNELPEPGTNATPAIAGGCLLLRGKEHLYCIE